MQEWLPEDHLAHVIVEAVEQLDLLELDWQYGSRGMAAFPSAILLDDNTRPSNACIGTRSVGKNEG